MACLWAAAVLWLVRRLVFLQKGALGMLGLGVLGRGMYTPLGQKALRRAIIPGASGTLRSPATAGLLGGQIAPSVQETLLGPSYP